MTLAVVLVLALVVRLAYLWMYSGMPEWDQLTVDNYYHHNWAQLIAGGDLAGDTTYFRAPFYVFCLGLLYFLFGSSLWVGRLFGLAIGLGSIAATYFIGRRVVSTRVGLLAALIQALCPVLLYFEGELLLDPLFMLLLQLGMLFWLRWRDSLKTCDIFAAGLLLGLASITRPTGLVVVLLLAILTLVGTAALRVRLRQTLIMLAAVALAIAPVSARNLTVANDPTLIASQGGINLYLGNNDAADGISARMPEPYGYNWQLRDVTYLAEQTEGRALKPGELSGFWTCRAADWIVDHPARAAKLYVTKLYRFLSNDEISNNRQLGAFFSRMPLLRYDPFSFAILLAFGVVGLILTARRNSKTAFLAALIVVYIMAGALFFFSSRFRLPLLPFLIVLASVGAVELVGRLVNRSGRVLIPTVTLVLVWMFSYLPLVPLAAGASCTGQISEGLYSYRVGDFIRAREIFAEARAIDSTFPEVNLNLGVTWLKLGRSDSADFYFRREQRSNPARAKTYINRASLKLLAGDPDSAETLVNRAVELIPYDVTARRLQLRIASEKSADDDSLYSLARQAATATRFEPALANEAAIMLSERGADGPARELLQGALRSRPTPIERDDRMFEPDYVAVLRERERQIALSHYQLGFLAGRSGDFETAVYHTHRSIALDPTRAAAWINLVSGLLSTGDRRQADSVRNEASRRFPDDARLKALLDTAGR